MPKKKVGFMDVYDRHYDRSTERPGDASSWRAGLSSIQQVECAYCRGDCPENPANACADYADYISRSRSRTNIVNVPESEHVPVSIVPTGG